MLLFTNVTVRTSNINEGMLFASSVNMSGFTSEYFLITAPTSSSLSYCEITDPMDHATPTVANRKASVSLIIDLFK